MKKIVLTVIAPLLLCSISFAHRLNEYLQATTISLSAKSVVLKIQLTPGTDIAGEIIKKIDANGDQIFSVEEQISYARQVSNDLQCTIDGKKVQLSPADYSYPNLAAIQKGIGEIELTYRIELDSSINNHRFELRNQHLKAFAVYLVNCLLPADTAIHVTGQFRNADQSIYQLNFNIGGPTSFSPTTSKQSLENVNRWAVIKTYIVHGVHHILSGYDHLLFLCALVLGAAGLWDLIKIVTAFTIAHSITLTLATYGLAHLPEQVVEPIIAASIVFVAVQNIVWADKSKGNTRLAVAFFFGLFHGLGFAGGLVNLMHAMPKELIILAIIGFSVGVEAGNQIVLIPLYLLLEWLKTNSKRTSQPFFIFRIRKYASLCVAVAGAVYFIYDLHDLF